MNCVFDKIYVAESLFVNELRSLMFSCREPASDFKTAKCEDTRHAL